MSGRQRSERDERRRSLGQNFLVDGSLISALVGDLDLAADLLVVDIGAGRGALTIPMAAAGARVWAVEPDPVWASRLGDTVAAAGVAERVRIIPTGLANLRLPREPYRVVANPPFGLTAELLRRLLDDPEHGPLRADLVLQAEVVRKHTASVPGTLAAAAWSPWWRFRSGRPLSRRSFRPVPSVDAAVLIVERRDPPILPTRLAPGFRETLRPGWGDGVRSR